MYPDFEGLIWIWIYTASLGAVYRSKCLHVYCILHAMRWDWLKWISKSRLRILYAFSLILPVTVKRSSTIRRASLSHLSSDLTCVADIEWRQHLRSSTTTKLYLPKMQHKTIDDRMFLLPLSLEFPIFKRRLDYCCRLLRFHFCFTLLESKYRRYWNSRFHYIGHY